MKWVGVVCAMLLPMFATAVDKKAVEAAVKKGVEFLKSQQKPDGSWTGVRAKGFPMGYTALALLALLKAGVSPDDECIKKGFDYLRKLPFQKVYSVSLLILALEALYEPPSLKKVKEAGKKGDLSNWKTEACKTPQKRAQDHFKKKAKRFDRAWLKRAVKWLLKVRNKEGIWRYPHGGYDHSNTQYALLALCAAKRLGIKISRDVWMAVAKHFIDSQEEKGPEVKPFFVPAADLPLSKLEKAVEEALEGLKKLLKEEEKMGIGIKPKDLMRWRTKAIGEEVGKVFPPERRKVKMFARGWRYRNDRNEVTGSMTTAGLASLVICKWGLAKNLERNKNNPFLRKLNQAIRDGAAWLAHRFSVSSNPGRADGQWLYYYLYGLERAGVLTMAEQFGNRNWYDEGAEWLLSQQRADGAWVETARSHKGDEDAVVTTAFAILFLKRGTVPVVRVPDEVIRTGLGLFRRK